MCDNESSKQTVQVTTVDALTLADAKKLVNADTLQSYIGTKILDYNPEAGGVWRIFYFDEENYFGDGYGTLYLKRDYVSNKIDLSPHINHTPTDGGKIMKQMNPLWRDSNNGTEINLNNEHAVSWLCDPMEWTQYKTSEAKYAIGSPSIEMYMKAFNVYKGSNTALVCKIGNINGYLVGVNNSYSNNSGYSTPYQTLEPGKGSVFMNAGTTNTYWIASPSASDKNNLLSIGSNNKQVLQLHYGYAASVVSICPIVCI